jgi:uncharacterized OsmC-like protein
LVKVVGGSIRTNDLASAKNIGGSANVWWRTLFIGSLNRVLTPLEISFLTGLIEGDKMMYSVEVTNGPGSTLIAKSKDAQITIGLDGKSMTPPDSLLASLGSCIGVYMRKYAQGAKLPLENFSIKLEAQFSKESPICFREIKVEIDLKGIELDERRKKALLEFVKNCPVHKTLEAGSIVEITLVNNQ